MLLGKLSRSVALRVSLAFVIFEKRYIVFRVKAVLLSIEVCKRQKGVYSCRRESYAKSTQVFTRRQFAERGRVSRDRIYRERLLVAAQCSLRRDWGTRWRSRSEIGGRRVRCDAQNASTRQYLDVCDRPSSEKMTAQVPNSYCCPISMEIMVEPVIVATGHTYDKECIQMWLSQGNRTCPATGQKLRHLELVPNFALRNAIQVFIPQHRGALSGRACVHCRNGRRKTMSN